MVPPPSAYRRLPLFPLMAVAVGVMSAAPALAAETLNGILEKVGNEGRSVTIAGTSIGVSASRTNICVAGVCDQGRDKLKQGMVCVAEVAPRQGKPEARRLSCK